MRKLMTVLICFSVVLCAFFGCAKNDNNAGETSNNNIKTTYDAVYSGYDESTVSAYESLCSGIINYEKEVRMNLGMYNDVMQLYHTSFPLSALVKEITEKQDGSGVTITYQFDEEEHLAKVKAFDDKITEITETCYDGTMNKKVYAIHLYHYIASSVKEDNASSHTCYDAIMNGVGDSFTFSNMFEYLLSQADIPAYHVIGTDAGGSSWGLSAAVIDDSLFYFDIMSEYYVNGGEQLVYFGMTSQDLKNEGIVSAMYTDKTSIQEATDLYFDICRSCRSWEIQNGKLLVSVASGDIVELAL